MKRIISLLICLILIISIAISAAALDINTIQPDIQTIIIGVTGEDVPIQGSLPSVNSNSNTLIIIPQTKEIVLNTSVDEKPTYEEIYKQEENLETEEVSLTLFQADIYSLINEQRLERNIELLEYNFNLQEAVDIRAKEISEHFAHIRPDGTDFGTAIGLNVPFEVAGENLLSIDKSIATIENIVNTWMDSEGHMKNILAERYVGTAIGIYEKNDIIYIVQIFIG